MLGPMACGHCRGKGYFTLGRLSATDDGFRTCPTCFGRGIFETAYVRPRPAPTVTEADVRLLLAIGREMGVDPWAWLEERIRVLVRETAEELGIRVHG